MASRDLYHGAEADKLLFNIRNGSLTADSQGRLFFAEREWQNSLIHGADLKTGESYVAKLRVEIPDGAQLAQASTSGNRDARILTLEPGAQVRAQVLELYVRRGRVGSFETETIPQAGVEAYLKNKTLAGRSGGGSGGGSGRGNPFASIKEEGYDPKGAELKMMGGIMALGALVGWLDDYFIDEKMKKDVAEWETYIRSRQPLDPATGFLLVAIVKKWQPLDAAYATRSYMGLNMVEAGNLNSALALASKDILPGLPAPSEAVSYEYRQMWIKPLRPKPTISSAEADEKAFGAQYWYPAFRRLQHSLEVPPDFSEALSVLVGSWMAAMIRMLDHLYSYSPRQFNELKAQLPSLREPINQARVGLAFRAVENHRSDSSFGLQNFLNDQQNRAYYNMLPPQQQKEIEEWIESGSGALKNTMQGQWEVVMQGKKYLYSFRLSGTVIYRSPDDPGGIAGEGTWDAREDGVRVSWPKTGTVEFFPAPLNTNSQPAESITKWGGTFKMQARKVNPYP